MIINPLTATIGLFNKVLTSRGFGSLDSFFMVGRLGHVCLTCLLGSRVTKLWRMRRSMSSRRAA